MTTLIITNIITFIGAFLYGSIVERGSFTRQVCKAAEDLRKAKEELEKKEEKKKECCGDKKEDCCDKEESCA